MQVMLDQCNKEFGTTYTKNDLTEWLTENILPADVAKYMWGPECWMNEDVQANAAPVEGALEGIQQLLANDHHLMIVSDRPASLFEVTRDWLDRNGLADIRLLFTRHKHSQNQSNEHMTKLQAAYLYKLRMMIDDSPHHPLQFAEKDYVDRVYLLDMPYNQKTAGEKIVRVSSWREIPWT